ncbi:hypothetical protein [Nakamurella endophytica]|uniref:Uncharacterized protein n=1 Tax=Nakamurella endophytica TaxID=1748367 RepID=A0A917WDH5_9ACTN|nr:hypothetical protein [Nakamurella endophytica]GGL92669.1 hypothetical protein GCM10011594_10520 [Nakamurella endophytica]
MPVTRHPYRRADGEHVGFLDLVADGSAVPVTLLGSPLADARPRAEAEDMLDRQGLSVLAARWWCLLPAVIDRGVALDVRRPAPGWTWRPVLLVEVRPSEVLVRPDPADAERAAVVVVPNPVADLLRREQP